MREKLYDLIIIGGGPAGFTAALYAARARLDVLVIERLYSGGMLATMNLMENYPGFEEPISGPDLALRMENQVRKSGAQILNEPVTEVKLDEPKKLVTTADNSYLGKAVILCMGTTPKSLGLPKEDRFRGAGISFCATCDGAFYRDKSVAVIGGGDTALEDALYLARICSKVMIVHRRDTLRATRILREEALEHKKIAIVWNSEVCEYLGESKLSGIKLKNVVTGAISKSHVAGVFMAIGSKPNNELVQNKVKLSESGHILTNELMETDIPGVYAAGDIREKAFRQVITAAADGAIAASMAERYISTNAVEKLLTPIV